MFLSGGKDIKKWIFLIPLITCPAIFVWAQDDPFGVKTDDDDVTASPVTPATDSSSSTTDREKDPIVLAVRDSNPSTPAEWMRALKLMIDIERFDEASNYLQSLATATVSDQQAFDLQRQVGTGFLIELGRQEELGDEAPLVARRILDSASRYARDPNRLNGLISQLNDVSIQRRTGALTELKAMGGDSIALLLSRLATDGPAMQSTVQDTLLAWGPTANDPLLAALTSDVEVVRITAMNVLGVRRVREAAVWLALPALTSASDAEQEAASLALESIAGATPTKSEAIQWIYRYWQYLESGHPIRQPDAFGQVDWWSWDADQGTVVWQRVDAVDASRVTQLWLTEDLLELDPANEEFQQLAWQGRLSTAKRQLGYNRLMTADDLTDSPSVDVLNRVLRDNLASGDNDAAIAAVELLGEIGDASLLESASGESTPIVAALRHSDRRMRLAAARTIIGWKPIRSFAGSNRVAEVLFYFVKSDGQPRVLIGHPGQQMNQTLKGLLGQIGYEADAARTGRALFFQARQHPDYEAILLSDAVDSPEILELVQQLRKDPRTSRIPIGLLPRLEYMDRAKRIARDSERVKAFPWPYQPETAKFELEELATVIPDGWPTANQRLDQAVESMQLLLQIVDLPRVFGFEDLHQHQDLLVERMYSPAMGATALQVVGHLSTPEGQTALVDYSNQGSLPMELRTAAVDAFETAVQKRGVLLTTRQIQTQYDRYNMSEFSGPETQQLLGRVLDIIEKPSSVGAR